MVVPYLAEKPGRGLAHWIAKTLPPRRIIVGSEHGARVYRLSRSSQIALIVAAAAGVASVGWIAITRTSVPLHDKGLMIDLDLRSVLEERDMVRAERNRLKTANGALSQQLASVGSRIQSLFEGQDRSQQAETGAMARAQDAPVAAATLTLWTSKIDSGIGVLEQQMTSLRSSRAHIIKLLADTTAHHITGLEGVIKSTGLNVDKLLAAARKRDRTRGTSVADIDGLNLVVGGTEVAFENMKAQVRRLNDLQDVVRRLPVVPPLETMAITSGFGKRRDPFTKHRKNHEGLDFRARKGTPIYAPADGTVTYAGRKGSYGRFIEIDHGAGVRTRYGHMAKLLVKKGQKVAIGSQIGQVGNSGRSTGVHLHYEIRYFGRAKDPMTFIRAGWHVFKG